MHTNNTRPNNQLCCKLDESARANLLARAALFDIQARIEGDRVRITISRQSLNLCLPLEIGLCRIVAELAEVLTPWVIFSASKLPEDVLLRYTDVKYRKLVEFWRLSLAPAGTCVSPTEKDRA
jgi:hypothetical protein